MLSWIRERLVSSPAEKGVNSPRALAEDWTNARRSLAARDTHLTDESERWLWHIAEFAWPNMLCAKHPRIANELASLWNEPESCEAFLADRPSFTISARTEGANPLLPPRVSVSKQRRSALRWINFARLLFWDRLGYPGRRQSGWPVKRHSSWPVGRG